MPNPNMTYEELHEEIAQLVDRAKGYGYTMTTIQAADTLIQLFATLCAEVIGKIPPESEHWRYSGELLGRIQQQIQSTNRLAQLTTKNTEEENV